MVPFPVLANLMFNYDFFPLINCELSSWAQSNDSWFNAGEAVEAQVVNANFEKLNPTGLRVIHDGPSIVISPNTNFMLPLFARKLRNGIEILI